MRGALSVSSFVFVLHIVGLYGQQASPAIMEETVRSMIERITPNLADKFVVEIPEVAEQDFFHLEQETDRKIRITASNGVSAASGYFYYLREYLHSTTSWTGSSLEFARKFDELPFLREPVHKDRFFKWSYNFNPTAAGYSTAWWDWNQWEEHIDYLAMRGVNMPLMYVGQEYVWAHTFMNFGVSLKDMEVFFSGPTFAPWQRMGNLKGWGGPLTTQWMTDQFKLGRKIFHRMRSFGMKPVLPGFSGRVPNQFEQLYPSNGDVAVTDTFWNDYFTDPNYIYTRTIYPTSQLFVDVGEAFVNNLIKFFGPNDHLYNIDLYNETDPHIKEAYYLREVSQAVMHSMEVVDKDAIWVMQGWSFFFGAFWTPELLEAHLGVIPDHKLIVLDLSGDTMPQWPKTQDFGHKPFIWCELLNFGGNQLITGRIETVMNEPYRLVKEGHTIVGIGATPEGIFTNEVMFDLIFEHAWRQEPIPVKQWLHEHLRGRYGRADPRTEKAWEIIAETAFNYPAVFLPKAKFVQRPNFWLFPTYYDYCPFVEAWDHLLSADSLLEDIPTYRHDVVDITRQVLSNLFDNWFFEAKDAYDNRDGCAFQTYRTKMLGLLTDLDEILSSHETFLLGKWMQDAERWAQDKDELEKLRTNAKYINTLWDPAGVVKDYAAKQWAGLVSDYYLPRWEIFFDQVLNDLQNHKEVRLGKLDRRLEESDRRWIRSSKHYSSEPQGDSLAIARRLLQKYLQPAREACVHYVPLLYTIGDSLFGYGYFPGSGYSSYNQ
mmetsp:Transcript_30513/g.34682  ORF Transcript_30513/g.34682 Transcript_30513/m.34682 type:complete len:769 (-) Transcript_30513:141-2447(-)|eukprot:CAMPEP_0115000074 /NCGR_PEP_ID=MMETSP0216-20121206/16531_1 /TAXON_ID=223996 /ORGANISM="Protocruzia adherens, Strain Boccale" /LENGTH=768 /DNA_ID=CAMNT_0002365083 /DNA_START=229 /DNA_END=2535 /DNA_ORIENTATION=+